MGGFAAFDVARLGATLVGRSPFAGATGSLHAADATKIACTAAHILNHLAVNCRSPSQLLELRRLRWQRKNRSKRLRRRGDLRHKRPGRRRRIGTPSAANRLGFPNMQLAVCNGHGPSRRRSMQDRLLRWLLATAIPSQSAAWPIRTAATPLRDRPPSYGRQCRAVLGRSHLTMPSAAIQSEQPGPHASAAPSATWKIMASGSSPTGGRAAICAAAEPKACRPMSPLKMIVRTHHARMSQPPGVPCSGPGARCERLDARHRRPRVLSICWPPILTQVIHYLPTCGSLPRLYSCVDEAIEKSVSLAVRQC